MLDLLRVEESSAASHKCHFRVRHFGRVFNSPYKNPLRWILVRLPQLSLLLPQLLMVLEWDMSFAVVSEELDTTVMLDISGHDMKCRRLRHVLLRYNKHRLCHNHHHRRRICRFLPLPPLPASRQPLQAPR